MTEQVQLALIGGVPGMIAALVLLIPVLRGAQAAKDASRVAREAVETAEKSATYTGTKLEEIHRVSNSALAAQTAALAAANDSLAVANTKIAQLEASAATSTEVMQQLVAAVKELSIPVVPVVQLAAPAAPVAPAAQAAAAPVPVEVTNTPLTTKQHDAS